MRSRAHAKFTRIANRGLRIKVHETIPPSRLGKPGPPLCHFGILLSLLSGIRRIHLGHQAFFRHRRAAGPQCRIHCFSLLNPRRAKFFVPEPLPLRLSTTRPHGVVHPLGLSRCGFSPFTLRSCAASPAEFWSIKVSCGDLHIKAVLVGANFRFRASAGGQRKLLSELGCKTGSRRGRSACGLSMRSLLQHHIRAKLPRATCPTPRSSSSASF